jgi:hypothetical protein
MSERVIHISDQRLVELHRRVNILIRRDDYYGLLLPVGDELSKGMGLNRLEGVLFRFSFSGSVVQSDLEGRLAKIPSSTHKDKVELINGHQESIDEMSKDFSDTVKIELLTWDRNVSGEEFDLWVKSSKNAGLIVGSIFTKPELPLDFLKSSMINLAAGIRDKRINSPLLKVYLQRLD